ncbi:MAG: hypothetical protein IOC90_17565 [Methylocystis sp.]|jgi:citrate lyase beta subunit|nr:hypothetical protein [Methylocystis sp.]MCA3589816.1 hypothetical protein [Methylocystis sp.]MCA3591585.1 hypothetical protein [Methylocystis sp.]
MNSHLLRTALYAPAFKAGRGVVALSGRMVERLHRDAAEARLAMAALIAAKGRRD